MASMVIRCKFKHIEAIQKQAEQYKRNVVVEVDEKLPEQHAQLLIDNAVVLQGYGAVMNWLEYGYNRIIQVCPYTGKKCRGEDCQHYLVENGTGDCATRWQAILLLHQIHTNSGIEKRT